MAEQPILFVHGWATDSWVWEPVAKGLGGPAVKIDLPGHGGKGSWDEPTLRPAMRAIEAALGSFGGQRPVGVGWSLGSMALLATQAEMKDAFSALVLVGSTPCFVQREGFPWGQSRALVKRMIMDMKKDPASTVNRFYGLNFTGEELATTAAIAMMERYRYPGPVSCEGEAPGCFPTFRYDEMTTALEALYNADLREALPTIEVPTLIVHGANDAVCPVEAAGYLGRSISSARLDVVARSGHAPHLTGAEHFSTTLNDFLARL